MTVVAGLIVLGSGGSLAWGLLANTESRVLTLNWFQHLLGRVSFAEQRLLPSWWFSSGLLEAARNQWQETMMFLLLLIANALLMSRLAVWLAGRAFRAAYSGLAGSPGTARLRKHPWLDRLLLPAARLLPPQTRLLFVKNLRLFHRDPVQWSQFAVFFGLLALYFLNIRRFSYDISYIGWMNMVSFLNVSVVGLLLSTFTTRFVSLHQPGRPPLLDPGLAAHPTGHGAVEQVLVCVVGGRAAQLATDRVERSDAARVAAGALEPPVDLPAVERGLGRSGRRPGGHHARPPRSVAGPNCRQRRRHTQSGDRHGVYHGGGLADGHALPFLFGPIRPGPGGND